MQKPKMSQSAKIFTTILFLSTFILSQALDPKLQEAQKAPKIIKVGQGGEFKTVTDAVNSVPVGNTVRTILAIAPGVYKEKITVPRTKPFITFYGTDTKNPVTLTFDGTALKYGTVNSATVAVESDYFMAVNIAFENTSPEPDGVRKGAQAVAMRISGDFAAFYNCRFLGFQDTLCDDAGRHYFDNCYIEGTVDFIFGRGKSFYYKTELHSVSKDFAAITAHAREKEDDDSVYIFVDCKVTGTGDIFLGRVWKERARVVFANSFMDDNVNPEGWAKNERINSLNMFYAEYKNTGPGAPTDRRAKFVKVLSDAAAKPYLDKSYIDAGTWLLPPPKL